MKKIIACFAVCFTSTVFANHSITVPMQLMNQTAANPNIGSIEFTDTKYGLLIKPNLKSLPPGSHGFHIHEKPSCNDNGLAAKGHLDPNNTQKHLGPYNSEGHAGDLPVLFVDQSGHTSTPLLAPKLKVSDIENHAVIIHDGGDNYSDHPPLGGGGARIACGVAPRYSPNRN